MNSEEREERLMFAAKHGDRYTFDKLGGSPEQWGRWKSPARSSMRNLSRGIV